MRAQYCGSSTNGSGELCLGDPGLEGARQTVSAGRPAATPSEEETLGLSGEEREPAALRPGETCSLGERETGQLVSTGQWREEREIQPDTPGPSGPLGPPPGPESPGPGRTPGGTSHTGRPLTEPGTPPPGPRGGGAAAPPRPPSCWGRRSQLISPVTTQTIASSSTGLQGDHNVRDHQWNNSQQITL